jgi:alginate O-acetyltransferase complex protein AlgI
VGVDITPPTLSIILPIGISFYTFQSISYVVDVYRGTFGVRKTIREYLAALTFFPHLVAGPIVRSSFILPQFDKFTPARWDACVAGFLLIAVGLLKKTAADLLGVVADGTFDAAGPFSAVESWTGSLAFAGQVYGDFSGYSDMATGLALLLGIMLPPNFNLPYLAWSPVEFWRRWHISLSTWLRDYLYISLGGSRGTAWRTYVNLGLTMLLGGLWHGASWTFVLWGLYHGLLLTGTHLITRRGKSNPNAFRIPAVVKVALTFYLVTIGWVLFRAKSLDGAFEILRGMHLPDKASEMGFAATLTLLLTVIVLVGCHLLDWVALHTKGLIGKPWRVWPLITLCTALAILLGGSDRPFIYFQF